MQSFKNLKYLPRHGRRCIVAAFALLSGCGSSADRTVGPSQTAGLHFVASSPIRDTVDAYIDTPVVAELRDSTGRALVNINLQFSVATNEAFLRPTAQHGFGTAQMLATTDSLGRASAWLKLGALAKSITVRVLEGARVWTDSVTVTSLPGNGVRLQLLPRDTAVLVGKSVAFRSFLLDRHGNAIPGTSALTPVGSTVTAGQGADVVGGSIGRAVVRAKSGSFNDSVFVSVVPPGTIAAHIKIATSSETGGIYAFNTDGTNAHWIYHPTATGAAAAQIGLGPASSPDGSKIAFIDDATLRITASSGVAAPVDVATGANSLYAPQFSADGQWIYFTRGSFGYQNTFWRVHPDGTGLTQISEQRSYGVEAMPSPSPVDDRVAYETNVLTNDQPTIRLISSTTRVIQKLDVAGASPRWSPLGDRIGYIDRNGLLSLMTPTGSVLGKIGAGISVERGFNWSPSADWLAAETFTAFVGSLSLVEVATGRTIPLAFAAPDGQGLIQPVWIKTP